MANSSPLDDVRALLTRLPAFDDRAARRVRQRLEDVGTGQPLGALDMALEWLAGASGRTPPSASRPLLALFAGSHALEERLRSASPARAAAGFVDRSGAGRTAVNQLCAVHEIGLKVFDLALDVPVNDIAAGPALDEKATAATMAFGMEAIAGGTDLVCLGSVGTGASTVAAALLSHIYEDAPDAFLEAASPPEMGAEVRAVLARLAGGGSLDPLVALGAIGGREFAALGGAILAARMERIPVLLDGFPALAAASVLKLVEPGAIDHCRLASVQPGSASATLADRLGLKPLLDFAIPEGEGISAALGARLLKTAAAVHSGLVAAMR